MSVGYEDSHKHDAQMTLTWGNRHALGQVAAYLHEHGLEIEQQENAQRNPIKPLSHYQNLVDQTPCPECGNQLERIEGYNHSGGWLVEGYSTRQWLSAKCTKCRYDFSLWKIGIMGSIEHPEVEHP
jgi:hypothetical protein